MNNKIIKVKEINELFRNLTFLKFKTTFSKFKDIGLHPNQFFFLNIIFENDGITQKELTTLTNRERATITKTLQRLEKSALITKVNHNDNKSSKIYLTEKGKEIHSKIKELQDEELIKLLGILNDKELEDLSLMLKKLITHLEGEKNK